MSASARSIGELVVTALARHPERTAFIHGEREISYAETLAMLHRLGRALADRGLGKGDGLAILSRNRPEAWMVPVAGWLLGARNTPLHALGSIDDHRYICENGEIHTLVFDPEPYAEHVAQLSGGGSFAPQLLALGPSDDCPDLLALAEAADSAPLPPPPLTEDDLASIIFTGGTTGYPKGVMRPHRCLLDAIPRLATDWDWPPGARYLATAPLTHISGILVIPTLTQGGTVVVEAGFDPERWCAAVERYRATVAFVVPTMLYALLDHPVTDKADLSSLERIFYGAAPSAPARIAEALERFGPILVQGWGQAESTVVGTILRADEHDPAIPGRLATCGRPLPGIGFEVQDEDGRALPPGEIGELCLQGPFAMDGYWKQPEQSTETLRNGWLRTGDMGHQDADGWVTIVDRRKDMIISGGFNVFAREVESALASHPAVAAAAVFGMPDPRWGEAVTAAVVLRPGATADADELVAHVRDRKGAVQAPKRVEFIDQIPTTALGKPDKKALRARFGPQ